LARVGHEGAIERCQLLDVLIQSRYLRVPVDNLAAQALDPQASDRDGLSIGIQHKRDEK
jgi:hypothetical protein